MATVARRHYHYLGSLAESHRRIMHLHRCNVTMYVIEKAANLSKIAQVVLVSSSMNSGTPSARSPISATISGGSALLPATLVTIVLVSLRSSRARVSMVTCGCPIQGGWN